MQSQIVQHDPWHIHNAICACHSLKRIIGACLYTDASANALFISIFWPFQHWNEMREKDSDV